MSEQTTKKPYLSKTLWTNLVLALVAFFPGARDFIAGQPDIFMWAFAFVNIVLRFVTKDKIELK